MLLIDGPPAAFDHVTQSGEHTDTTTRTWSIAQSMTLVLREHALALYRL